MTSTPVADVQTALPPTEFHRRLVRAQVALARRNVDALFVFASEGYPHGTRYFFDHWPSFEPALAVIPAQGTPLLLTGPETEQFARSRAPHGQVHAVEELFFWAAPDYVGIQAPGLGDVIADLFGNHDGSSFAITPYHAFPKPVADALARVFPAARLQNGDDILVELRSVKSPEEVNRLRAASLLAERVFEEFLGFVKPGISELDVMDFVNERVSAGGSEAPAYFGWCASGPNTTNPIFRATARRLTVGDIVQVNIGPRLGGYSGSVGRAVGLGRVSDDARQLVGDAIDLAAQTTTEIVPGKPASEVAQAIGLKMRERGYPGLYGPAHSTGMEECELPWIQESATYDLTPGMTFNIDLWLERDGLGVRIEDGIVVTESGCEVFSPRFHEFYVI